EDMGIDGPISLNEKGANAHGDNNFRPVRVKDMVSKGRVSLETPAIKRIFDLQSNILVMNSLEEVAKSVLKGINALIPGLSRAAFFQWSAQSRQLIPMATHQFQSSRPFFLSQKSFEDVITRKQGILLFSDSSTTPPDGSVCD